MQLMKRQGRIKGFLASGAILAFVAFHPTSLDAQSKSPPFDKVSEGYKKVNPAKGSSFYNIWVRGKDAQILAELPRGYKGDRFLIATTVAGGHYFAGLQWGMRYVYWKRYDDRLALVEPNLEVRASGDPESQDSVKRIWTDRVILDVPIITKGPSGQPVIDMDSFLTGNLRLFFGYLASGANSRLAKIEKAKVFPENVELALEMPAQGGTLRTFHYSIRKVKGTPGYKPRKADERVGYFTVDYSDLGKYNDEEVKVSYITRWPLEKRDSKLNLSPPKQPVEFYVEHTVPVRYRRWIKRGIEYWNRAFEKIGIHEAIQVHYQDKVTGDHMDLDPEDARYNFIRWLNNDIGTAIGPSRAHPETGEILDADIVLTDGWIRHFWYQYNEFMPQVAMEGFDKETIQWLDRHPAWDPRIRLAPPDKRAEILAERMRRARTEPDASDDPLLVNNEAGSRLANHLGNAAFLCMAADGKSRDMQLMGLHLAIGFPEDEGDEGGNDEEEEEEKEEEEEEKDEEEKKDEKDEKGEEKKEGKEKDEDKKDEKKKGEEKKDKKHKKDEKKDEDEADKLDGIPEWFVGPMLADLVAHEVGHTLGLRHNFKASSVYSLKEINTEEFKGKKPFTGSVMDYNPVNIRMGEGSVQGDYAMIDIGPYDMWAIEYGYTLKDPKKTLARVSEPELIYGPDEDTAGSDPRARRYDLGEDPLKYAKNRMKIAKYHRKHLLDRFVKEGDAWHKARRGYLITLNTQLSAMSVAANWLGGSFAYRDHKGDPGDRRPVSPVPAEKQRQALKFVIKTAFEDSSYGLTPEILAHMTTDKRGFNFQDEAWPVHDSILGVQASALTMILNPSTLRSIYDNEYRTPSEKDALTLPEVLEALYENIWREVDSKPDKDRYTARKPMISSLRRNLQREHLERLIDLLKPDAGYSVAYKPISNLVLVQLRGLKARLAHVLEQGESKIDPYSVAHLTESKVRIEQVLDAEYIYNTDDLGGGGGFPFFFFFEDAEREKTEE